MPYDIPVAGLALDIDETLSDTNTFWVIELSRLFGKPDHLSHRDIVRQWRYTEHVPFWNTPDALAWMEEARASSDFQERIPLIGNCNHIVERVHALVPIAAYITARPQCVRIGTERWLAKHDFPDAPLIMKPTHMPHSESTLWKATLLAELSPGVRGIVDDNPGLIEHLPEGYQGTIFLYDCADHLVVPRPDLHIVSVPTWDHVLPAVMGHLAT